MARSNFNRATGDTVFSLREGETFTYTFNHATDREPEPPPGLDVTHVQFSGNTITVHYVAMCDVDVRISDFTGDAFDQYRQDLIDFAEYRQKLRERYASARAELEGPTNPDSEDGSRRRPGARGD